MRYDRTFKISTFHMLVRDSVYEVELAHSGREDNNGRYRFNFQFSPWKGSKDFLTVFVTQEALAIIEDRLSLMLIISRAAIKARIVDASDCEINTRNYPASLKGDLENEPLKSLREKIEGYIRKRYEIEFDSPFTVLEMAIAVPSTLDGIRKVLSLLQRNELIRFQLTAGVFGGHDQPDAPLVEEFSIVDKNYNNLGAEQYVDSDRTFSGQTPVDDKRWDFFICHASEDKQDIVIPLADELKRHDAKVWVDAWTLTIGDSLSRKIDEGLTKSRFGIVVLSKSFFAKEWPQKELAGLVQKEINGQKVILPVWHEIDRNHVLKYSPMLADRMAARTSEGISEVARQLLKAAGFAGSPEIIGASNSSASHSEPANVKVGFAQVNRASDPHLYALQIAIKLLAPPAQGSLRLKLLWPNCIPIVKTVGISEGGDAVEYESEVFRELTVNWEMRIYPGETVELVGEKSEHQLTYEFNGTVYNAVHGPFRRTSPSLRYWLYIEGHQPMSGAIPMKDLNNF
jgi:hypothetical protein